MFSEVKVHWCIYCLNISGCLKKWLLNHYWMVSPQWTRHTCLGVIHIPQEEGLSGPSPRAPEPRGVDHLRWTNKQMRNMLIARMPRWAGGEPASRVAKKILSIPGLLWRHNITKSCFLYYLIKWFLLPTHSHLPR